jgi:hypothetical protein
LKGQQQQQQPLDPIKKLLSTKFVFLFSGISIRAFLALIMCGGRGEYLGKIGPGL